LVGSKLGQYSYVGSDSFIQNSNIGSFCSIGSLVRIGLPSHPTQYISTSPLFYDVRLFKGSKVLRNAHNPAIEVLTIIGSDVWIGENALILAGLTVGTGAVIGAGAVVTKDVRPYSIVVGNPAREIRTRFSEETIDRILETRWWEKNDTYLGHVARHYDDINTFLNETNHF
jgi:acetyltransferase-like isoleucine patch superfamily enzyme